MRNLFAVLVAVAITITAPAWAKTSPLVDGNWVKGRIGEQGIVFVDLRHPGAYAGGHVPGAVLTSYGRDKWRVKRDGVPGMLPDAKNLAKLIGGLGIGNATHVVLLPGGLSAGEMGVATRIYWTLKAAGHDAVSILDGGMSAYLSDKTAPLTRQPTKPVPTEFRVRLRPEYLVNAADVRKAMAAGTTLIDHRPNDQFQGINKSSSVRRHGTITGARNLPGQWATVDNGGTFRSPDALRTLYAAAGVSPESDAINFCNTGHWASLGWFVAHELLGNRKARLYDGSLADWTGDTANPVERHIKLP